jgi:predicted RND superfamily exporter protein
MWEALKNNIAAVLISATILSTAGFALAATSQQAVIADLGLLLGRGTVLSFTMVVTVLPALLLLLDKWIQRTTLNHRFYQEKEGK